MKSQIDHLVIAAQTLEQGVAWCQATLGIEPEPGGDHKLFGTHNRLFKIATPANPLAYCEIIAINPQAVPSVAAPAKRWFDLDDTQLQAAVAIEPRLAHFVVSTDDVNSARSALAAINIDRGPALEASRHSRRGVIHWKITVREDGQRLFDGLLPTLIEWGKTGAAEPLRLHPRNSLPRSGVTLQGLELTHPQAEVLAAAYAAIGLVGLTVQKGPANLTAILKTPKGAVKLESQGL